jgi:hypothetical protein
MKWIKLNTPAYVNGRLRHPHEGALHLENDEADRLIKDEAGEDVSDDFPASADKAPVESVTTSAKGDPEKKENRK